ncbi:MAG: hypothetical protein KC912_00575 [Proteobacteria bacterium]|nr:hypothetical protein [Pseudomonadota bacterium]
MVLVLALVIGCGTTAAPSAEPTPERAVEAVVPGTPAPPTPPKVDEPTFDLPEGYGAMTLLMREGDVDSRVGVGSFVDLVAAGADGSEVLIAKEVEVLAAAVESRGSKVTFALTSEHRGRLLGSQLPGRPRAVLHE